MQFELAALLGPIPLGILFVIALAICAGFSIAFLYHWRAYGMHTRLIQLAPVVYLSVSGMLVALASISYLLLL